MFAEWFISRCFPEPHSTKAVEDGVEWALDTDPEMLIATAHGEQQHGRRRLRELASNLDCPVLVISGDRDKVTPPRDVAIARELRVLAPDLQINWLAQDPVTRVLEAEGERIHPASAHLANESKHIESESAEHDLHCERNLQISNDAATPFLGTVERVPWGWRRS